MKQLRNTHLRVNVPDKAEATVSEPLLQRLRDVVAYLVFRRQELGLTVQDVPHDEVAGAVWEAVGKHLSREHVLALVPAQGVGVHLVATRRIHTEGEAEH